MPQPSKEADDAKVIIDVICDKLDRVIRYLRILGGLPDIQYAVRILQSRKRELNRLWASKYGDANSMIKAKIELSVAKRDMGLLVRLGEKNHGVGRLDCRACATAVPSYLPSLFPQPLSRLCKHCRAGIQHAYQIEDFTPTVDQSGTNPPDQPAQGAVEVANGPQDLQILVDQHLTPGTLKVERHYECDNCGGHDVEYL